MSRLGVLLLAAVCGGAASSAWAADVGPPLTWEDCVALALDRNPDLASSRLAAGASRDRTLGSYNSLYPSLTLSNSYGDSRNASPDSLWGARAGASIDLFNRSNRAGIRSATASLAQAEAALRETSVDLRFDLRIAHARTLLSQEGVKVSEAIKAIRENGSRLVQLRYESGRESKGNMLRTRAELLRAEADLAQAARSLRTSQTALSRELGFDGFRALAATGTLTAGDPPAPDLDLAPYLTGRADVAVREAGVRSSEAALQRSESPLWPLLSASYARSWSGPDEFPLGNESWSLGAQLSYPLFGGGPTAAYHAVSASKKDLQRSKEDLRSARSRALEDLESARSAFAGAADQVRVQTALLEASRQRNDEANIRYASGLLSFDDWELIVSDRVNSERFALQARLNAVAAEAGWDRAVGKALGDE